MIYRRFGKTELQLPTKKITIEIKSLNSKNLDLNVRTPSYYKEKELNVRKKIANKLKRGKVDFSIFVESIGQNNSAEINSDTLKSYMVQLKEISTDASEMELLQMAIRLPETMQNNREKLDDAEWIEIDKAIDDRRLTHIRPANERNLGPPLLGVLLRTHTTSYKLSS